MNERARRHQHARRSNNHQSTHHHPPAGSSSSGSYQQPLNNHQHHNRSIAYHHGHPADTYSASNYRHPSTTTTATDPSSIAPSQSSDCAISICYSYLIAIFSSFLVVLGIYLSVTRFNVRFLYISLVGLLIEAAGACVYCISNIRASKLARRKQRINSDEFILNSGSNIDNNSLASNLNGHQTQHPQRHHQQNQQLQQQITTVTHILSNRDLTSSNISDEGNSRNNINENSSSAIINNNDNTQPPQPDQQTARHEQEPEGEQAPTADQASSLIPPTSENLEAQDGNSIIVIPSPSCRLLIGDQTNDGDQQTNQQADCSNQVSQPSCSNGIQPNQVANMTDEVNQQADTSIVRASPVTDTSNQLPNQDCQQSPTTTSGDFSASTNLLDDDLQQLNQQLHQQQPLEFSPKHHQRPAHLRRTMVIGLGGEEEMIEIDEQELDNMSILPPSYESITMNDPFKDK